MKRYRILRVNDHSRGLGYHLYKIDDYGDCISVPHWFRTKKEAIEQRKMFENEEVK